MPTRRAYLTSLASLASAAAAVGTASADHFDTQPEHVTIDFPADKMAQYQPLLSLEPADRRKLLGVYGWRARSPEHDTDVYVYWASYSHQEGWIGNLDSHYGDHEPLHVEVRNGSVERVRGSVYHWLKGETEGSAVPTDGDNPRLRVVNPWHQYTAASPDDAVERFDVADLRDVYASWLDNGLEQALHPGASTNPWQMRYRGHFWRKGFVGISTNATIVKAAKTAGIGTAGSLSQ